jgi:DNA polymerase III subunit delta
MPIYTFKDLPKILSEVEKGPTVPVYLITGDAYLSHEVSQQLTNLLLPEKIRSLNLEVVDGEKEDIQAILERIQTFPLFPGRKVVLVKHPVQIFSSGSEDRLWKKAEEAWRNGQQARCIRLLQILLQAAGIPLNSMEREWKDHEEALMEKLFPGKGIAAPDWFKACLPQIGDRGSGEPLALNPDQLLETALRQGFPENHILIFQMEGNPGSKKMVNFIAEKGIVLNFSLKQSKKGEQTVSLRAYLSSRLSREGKTIHPQAEALLLERIAPEVFLLEMELQKLFSYLGDKKQILPKDVLELTGANREEPLYELTTVLGEGNLEEGLRKLQQLTEQGYNPLQIMAGITNTLRRLLVAKELSETISEHTPRVWQDFGSFSAKMLPRLKQSPLPESLSKAHPFVLFNTLKAAEKFSRQHLITALEALHKADLLIKTSGATPTFLLEDFIVSFCRNKPLSPPNSQ